MKAAAPEGTAALAYSAVRYFAGGAPGK